MKTPLFFLLVAVAGCLFCSSAALAANGAQFVSQSVPASMAAGQTYPVSIIMKNTGTTTWTAAGNYRLGAQNPRDNSIWGANRVYLSSGDSIANGQSKIFTFNVTAPVAAGTYNFQWQMLQEGVTWFGGFSTNITVVVTAGTASTFYSADLGSVHHPFKGVGWDVNAGLPFSNYQTLLDDTAPQFVRVAGWDQSSYQPSETSTAYESAAIQPVYDLLQHAQQKNISVMLTNWNAGGKYDNYSLWPDHYFWLSQACHNDSTNSQNRWCRVVNSQDPGICTAAQKASQTNVQGSETDHPYSDTVFAQTLVNNLDYIINTKGFKVDFVGIWNEPGGDWAYHPRDSSKKYPASFTGLYQNMVQSLSNKGLTSKTKLVGIDDAYAASWPSTSIVNYALSNWASYAQAYSLHDYDGTTGSAGDVKYLFDRANGKPIIIGETGHKGADGCEDANGMDRWGNSIESTRLIISDARNGAYAIARWWFNGGDPATDCWIATSGNNVAVPATYNSLKILANSLPQTSQDISVVKTNFGDFDKNFDAVVINAAPAGQAAKPVVWAVNKGSSDRSLPINFTGLSGAVTFNTKTVKGSDSAYSIQNGSNYTTNQNQVTFVIPANSIFVAVAQGNTNICTPYSVSGCKVCKSDGSAWVDDSSQCVSGKMCVNGECVANCTNQCTSGAKQCGSNGGVQTCASSNGCLAWSAAAACPSGQTCSGGTCLTNTGTNAAQFVSQSVPSSMSAGQTYSVSVTMKNTGTTSWTEAQQYRLGAQNPQDNGTWKSGRMLLSSGETIVPGQSKTFAFDVIAPGAGTYNFQWRMIQENVQWFGDYSTNVSVAVTGADPNNASLITKVKYSGCIDAGFLNTGHSADLINRSGCQYIHRALDTEWGLVDFDAAKSKMAQVTKSGMVYDMFITEGINVTKTYYYPDESRNFNFSAMCKSGTMGAWGTNTCVPSYASDEYRKYLRYVTRKAIDIGIQTFSFAQVYMGDNMSSPILPSIIDEIKQYAASKGKTVLVGGQTNDISNQTYLRKMDYVIGGLGENDRGVLEAGSCLSRVSDICWALLYNQPWLSYANNVIIHMDWSGSPDVDADIFAHMSDSLRASFLRNTYAAFKAKGVGLMLPYGIPIVSNSICGSTGSLYTPDNNGPCKDESVMNSILGATTLLTDGSTCSTASQCQSGYCNCGYCVPGSTYCGGVASPLYWASTKTASNQWLTGYCNNGAWQTAANGYGCAITPSSACGYSSFTCASGYKCDTTQNNGQGGNGKCVTSTCTNQCTLGAKQCGTNGGVQTCTSSNGCTAWSAEVACSGGQLCSNNSCIPAPGSLNHYITTQYWGWFGGSSGVWNGITDGVPAVGAKYYSGDPVVAEKQLQQMKAAGINVVSFGWSNQQQEGPVWYDINPDKAYHDGMMQAPSFKDMKFTISYDLATRARLIYLSDNGSPNILPGHNLGVNFTDTAQATTGYPSYDFSVQNNGKYIYDELLSYDFDYLAKTYLNQPNYQKIGGKSVVYIYDTWRFNNGKSNTDLTNGFARALNRVRTEVYNKYGITLYLVGDFAKYGTTYWQIKPASDSRTLSKPQDYKDWGYLQQFDAVGSWNNFYVTPNGYESLSTYTDSAKDINAKWQSVALSTARSYRQSLTGNVKTAYGSATTRLDYVPLLAFSFRVIGTSPDNGNFWSQAKDTSEVLKQVNMVKASRDSSPCAEENSDMVYQVSFNQWSEGQTIESTIEDTNNPYPEKYGTRYLDAIKNSLSNTSHCSNVCSQNTCNSGNTGYYLCSDTNGDGCTELATAATACPSGQTCSNGICSGALLANGSTCGAASQCQSGYCNCGYCVPGSTYCGGVASPLYWASGSSSSNQWLTGYCNNGTWQTAANGYGCAIAPSSACGYSSFTCASGYKCDTTQNNGQGGNGKCVTSTCTNQCTLGAKQCSGNGVQTCVSSGGCLTWSAVVACPSGQTCGNGNCVTNTATSAAQFVSQSVPSSMTARQTYPVSITMKNTGTATWTAATNYKLGAQNPQDNGTWTGNDRVLLSAGESVAPGQSKTFTFNVTAPGTPGTYNFQWQMLQENVTWFGDKTTNVTVTVVSACTNQCTSGTTQCSGNGVQTCVLSGGCLAWSTVVACTSGQSCSNGNCSSTLLANGSTCSLVSQCQSGYCNCGYCVPGSAYCGGVANPLYWASGSSSSNQWLTGYCNNGTWQTAANGYGCAITPSFVCGYFSFTCVSGYKCDTTQNNGQGGNGKCVTSTCANQCTSGAKQCSGNGVQTCVSSNGCLTWSAEVACSGGQICSNGNCVASGSPEGSVCTQNGNCVSNSCVSGVCCGSPNCEWGDGIYFAPQCILNGGRVENTWLKAICRNGAFKVDANGWGCGSTYSCDTGTCSTVGGVGYCRGCVLAPGAPAYCGSGGTCAAGTVCSAGNLCCPSGTCGWGGDGVNFTNECVANGGVRENSWARAICQGGSWKIPLYGWGCNLYGCQSGSCQQLGTSGAYYCTGSYPLPVSASVSSVLSMTCKTVSSAAYSVDFMASLSQAISGIQSVLNEMAGALGK